MQTDPIRVTFPITDKDYGAWQSAAEKGGRALSDSRRLRLRLADGSLYSHEGGIDFGDNKVDRETATVVMHARFPNAAGALLPNAFVRVLTDEKRPPNLLVVPSSAVMRTAKGSVVWTISADGVARSVPVVTGATWQDRTVVSEGIEDGARVVVAGGFKLKDGLKAKVVE